MVMRLAGVFQRWWVGIGRDDGEEAREARSWGQSSRRHVPAGNEIRMNKSRWRVGCKMLHVKNSRVVAVKESVLRVKIQRDGDSILKYYTTSTR